MTRDRRSTELESCIGGSLSCWTRRNSERSSAVGVTRLEHSASAPSSHRRWFRSKRNPSSVLSARRLSCTNVGVSTGHRSPRIRLTPSGVRRYPPANFTPPSLGVVVRPWQKKSRAAFSWRLSSDALGCGHRRLAVHPCPTYVGAVRLPKERRLSSSQMIMRPSYRDSLAAPSSFHRRSFRSIARSALSASRSIRCEAAVQNYAFHKPKNGESK